jgi:simple sugar transport system substrate-binding protein
MLNSPAAAATSWRASGGRRFSAGFVRSIEGRDFRHQDGRRRNQAREKRIMRKTSVWLAITATAALAATASSGLADEPIGKGVTMYMQMGGNAGDGATLARQTGAAQAAAAFGVELKEQFSAWAPETMINQFKEAVAAKPTCIEIMGHPGGTAFHDLVKGAVDQGIIVTVGNSPMTDLQNEFKTSGMGYAGVDLYAGGTLTAENMLAQGLKSGDEAMVYGVFSQAERGQSEKGLADTLEKAGLKVDRLEISQEVNSDTSLATNVLTSYIQAHPNLRAIGTQHGGITGQLAEILKKAGKKPGDIIVGGIDLAPATIDGLKSGYVSATLDQLLYLQGFIPVLQCVMTAKYKMPGLSLNTGAGAVTPQTIDTLVPLIEAGIR